MTALWNNLAGAFTWVTSFFINTLTPWQWIILLLVPPAVIALYFLKLKRQPLEVPSTYLWHRTIEDLHVNSLWQRLRQSILLLLQLLVILLVILAVLRPGWRGATLQGQRFIFLIDNSASMTATDIRPTRLDEARRRVTEMIGQMKSGDVAMVVSFSDRAEIKQPFTDSRQKLRRAVANIKPTNRTSDLDEALRVAASLANPGRTSEEGSGDVRWAEAREADLYIFTDGGFGQVTNFSMGNLNPTYVAIGKPDARNVGITAFSTQRNPERPEQLQAYARLENFTDKNLKATATLTIDGERPDTTRVELAAGEQGGVEFDLGDLETGTLQLTIDDKDDLAVDNVAYAAVNVPRQARVLVITPRNDALVWALSTKRSLKLADVSTATPKILDTKDHLKQANAGAYDLIVYDQCAPKEMPQANTLFIGRLPPGDAWQAGKPLGLPQIIDTQRTHPLMRFIDLGNVTIAEGQALEPPPGSTALIDAHIGTLAAVAPREGFEDCVLGFEIVGQSEDGERYANTDWVRRYSFPLFVHNFLEYLGGARSVSLTGSVKPGKSMTIRSVAPVDRITVADPSGDRRRIARQGQSGFIYGYTEDLGVYEVMEQGKLTQMFSVNLFDSVESDIQPRENIQAGHLDVARQSGWLPMRRELWRYLVVAGIVLLGLEWYIYNRRVYL
jgi:hypothetical protein